MSIKKVRKISFLTQIYLEYIGIDEFSVYILLCKHFVEFHVYTANNGNGLGKKNKKLHTLFSYHYCTFQCLY